MTDDDQTDSSAERNRRQLSDAARMRADLHAMLEAPAGRQREWLFRGFIQDRQYVWFEPMARSLAARWHRSDADDIFEMVALIQAQAWELVERTVRNQAVDAQPGGLLRTMVLRAAVKLWGQVESPLTQKQLAFLRFSRGIDGERTPLTQAVVNAFNQARRAGAPQMTNKELVAKSRFITEAEVEDIRFLLDSGQITATGDIRTVGQLPDYRYTAVISSHETSEFLLAMLAEIAQRDMNLYAVARIYVGGTPMYGAYDPRADQHDNNLGTDFHTPEELADTLSITLFEAKRIILEIQHVAHELVLRDGWDPRTDTRITTTSSSPAL